MIKITMYSDNQQQPIKLLSSRFNSRSQLTMESSSRDKSKTRIHHKTFSVCREAWSTTRVSIPTLETKDIPPMISLQQRQEPRKNN